ncbi:unnamed protein product [Phyllotreta striolata]|uniref:NADH dehydrogenase [ubiquinone] 1 beta subcomplex subunit 6 n=1 Tax=Phyllotreta striolata TaxID=444603 RepID=A0A9N9XRN4_PHYSR|nr:unnamed protein product [Phyllotreta striolata]
MSKASPTGGVKPMPIAGRLVSDRERLLGMTEAERAFRRQWLKDQELAPTEPRPVPEMYKATHNPIRRFYRWPLDQLGKALEPRLGLETATAVRNSAGRFCLVIGGIFWLTYYVKYNSNDWTRKGGMQILSSRPAININDPGFPYVPDRSKPSDYYDRGFKKSGNLNL